MICNGDKSEETLEKIGVLSPVRDWEGDNYRYFIFFIEFSLVFEDVSHLIEKSDN